MNLHFILHRSVLKILLFQVIGANILLAQPTITDFTPKSGSIGSTVTITGMNFDPSPENNIVYFGATKAEVTSASNTQLLVTVPVGATFQPITVLVNQLQAYSSTPFIVTFGGSKFFDASSYASKVDFSPGSTPHLASIGDLDGDGKADIAVADGSDISVFRNTSENIGSITFESRIDYAAGNGEEKVALGDLDGDGKLDMVAANRYSDNVSVFLNTSPAAGTISFDPKIDFVTGGYPQSVTIGDIDNDGKPDLVVSNYWDGTVSILRNTSPGVGTISFAAKVDFGLGGWASPEAVIITDLDRDGKTDVITANSNENYVTILRNTSSGAGNVNFAAAIHYEVGRNQISVAAGDFNGDGKADLAVSKWGGQPFEISIARNTSTGPGSISFAQRIDLAIESTPSGISIADLNGDGKPEVAVAIEGFSGNATVVSVFKNTNSEQEVISFDPYVNYTTGVRPLSVSIGDLDGDGKSELAVSNYSSGTLSVLRYVNEINTETDFISFSLPEEFSAAVINEVNHTIEIEIDYGTDPSSMIPTFVLSPGATALVNSSVQVSGTTANDFTNPVIYTVTAEDGVTSQDWTVTVIEGPPNTENDILDFYFTEFELPGAVTDFDGNSYDVVLIGEQRWFQENLQALHYNDGVEIPHVSDYNAWQVLTTPGYAFYKNDQSTYGATYGPLYNWHVINTGKLCPEGWRIPTDSDWNKLVEYLGGASVAGGKMKEVGIEHWGPENIGATNESGFTALPGGARIGSFGYQMNLGFWWSSTSASNSNAYRRDINWSGPDIYRSSVTKRDGYSCRCVQDVNTAGSAQIANINSTAHTVDVMVPYGSDITNLTSNFIISSNATIEIDGIPQLSGVTTNDFTSSITYTIIAQDGISVQDWVVTVSELPPNTQTDIIGFVLAEQTNPASIDLSNHIINIEVAYGTNVKQLIPNISLSPGASVVPESNTQVTFSEPVTYTVTAEDGITAQDWVVNVSIGPSYETDITAFSLIEQTSEPVIDVDAHTVVAEVEYGVDITSLVPNIELSLGATISPESGLSQDFTVPVTYTVTAEDGITIQEWLVTVTMEPNIETDITQFAFSAQTGSALIDLVEHTVDIEVDYTANLNSLIPNIGVSPGATIFPQSGVAQNFTIPVTYTVTAEDGILVQDWVVTVSQAVLGIEDKLSGIEIYPNPVEDVLKIEITNHSIDLSAIAILDISGQVIESIDIGDLNDININLINYPSGIYLLRIIEKDNIHMLKILKD